MRLIKINCNAYNSDGHSFIAGLANKLGDVLIMGSARNSEKRSLKYYI